MSAASDARFRHERVFDASVLAAAAWTLLCHVAVVLGFGLDAVIAGACALSVAAGVFVLRRPRRPPPPLGPAHSAWLAALLVVAVGAALLIRRPDTDDSLYVNLAVTAADAPHEALHSRDGVHGIAGSAVSLPVYRIHSLEVFTAAISRLTGIPAIVIAHRFLPLLGALWIVLANARLLRRIAPARWLAATTVLLILLLWVGGEHRWHANFGFVRLQQGKAWLVTAVLPLIAAYGVEFGERAGRARWLRLAASQVAAIGISSTAIWAAPAMAGLALATTLRLDWTRIRTVALGLLTTGYAVGVGLALLASTRAVLTSARDVATERVFGTALTFVFGSSHYLAWTLLAIGIAALSVPKGAPRRFVVLLPLGVAAFFFNPWVAVWVAESVTGAITYWRVLWLIPIPLFWSLAVTAPLALPFTSPPARRLLGGLTLLVVAAFAWWVPTEPLLTQANEVRFDLRGLAVRPAWRVAEELVRVAPRHSVVVAPPAVSIWVPTFHDHPYALSVKPQFLHSLSPPLDEADIERRLRLTRFVMGAGEYGGSAERFLGELAPYEPGALCFPSGLHRRLAPLLTRSGWTRVSQIDGHEIWTRPPNSQTAP